MLASKSNRQKALLALAWVSIAWGTTWLASRMGVMHMPALQLVGIRQFIGGAVFIIYFLLLRHPFPKGKQWITIGILSVLNFVLSNGLVIWGVKYISSGLGAIIGAIFPLWLVMITMAKGSRLPAKALLGMVMGFGGVCIIFYDHLKDFLDTGFRFGIFLSLTASVTWAFGTLYTQKKADSFNPYYSLGFQMFFSGLFFLAVSDISGDAFALKDIPAISWWAIAYLVVIGSTISFVAYVYALRHLPASLTSVYAYINPIIAVLLGAAVLDEKLNGYIALGGAVTIAGVFLVNDSFRKRVR